MKVKVLNELDHIRKRPGMYIGDNTTPNHLVTELLDNALDELVNGHSNYLSLTINKYNVTVIDKGRGIPIHNVKLPDGKIVDSVVAIATKLFSSGKFDRDLYDISIGLNGVGLVVVNAFSKQMTITTKYKKHHRQYVFKEGKLHSINDIPKQDYSTKVEVEIDPSYFERDIDIDVFLTRLQLVKEHYPESTIILNGNEIESIGWESFVRKELDIPDDIPLFNIETRLNKKHVSITFTYDLSDKASLSYIVKGDVNLKTSDGTYISNYLTLVQNVVNKIKPKHYVLTKTDSLVRLRAYVSLLVPEPKFDSQNKTRYIGNERDLMTKLEPSLSKLYKSDRYLQHVLEKLNEYRILKQISKSNKSKHSKSKISVDNPVKSAKNMKRLYIVEGMSAAGTLTQIRNPKYEAVFPLKGKIINVESNSLDKVLNNKEVKYLLEILGIELGKDYETKLEDIVIVTDADEDGFHISTLLLLLLYKFAKKYIQEGKVKVVIPPLYAYKEKGRLVFHKSNTPPDRKDFIRYKGLGEMNPSELEQVIRDTYFYLKVELDKFSDKIVKLVTDTKTKRKVMAEIDLKPFDLLIEENGDIKLIEKAS